MQNDRHGRTRDPAELRFIEETITAIRLRTRHHDPYEEWEKQTRLDAFHTARKEQHAVRTKFYNEQDKVRSADRERLAAQHALQVEEVQSQLSSFRLKQQADENKLQAGWKEQNRKLWERINRAIHLEEEKVRQKLEAERRSREEEERKRKEKEEEEKRKAEEERLKNQLLEEKKKKEAAEAEERKRREEIEKLEEQQRQDLQMTTSSEDWRHGRDNIKGLKAGPMKNVKSDKVLKSAWSTFRRQITPKIGQLTNDSDAILRISQQLRDIIMQPPGVPPHPQDVYLALLSSLSKAILLQAETEVTAEKRSAFPLAQVTANLFTVLEHFPDIFWCKLIQRAGCWPVPIAVSKDKDGDKAETPWANAAERKKAMGYRESDGDEGEYIRRMAGIMRVYFSILWAPVRQRLHPYYGATRYWEWFSRLMSPGNEELLESAAAAEVIYAGLDVAGVEAQAAFGGQWEKLLGLLYLGATEGIRTNGSETRTLIGGNSAEGKAARVRMMLEIERIIKAS